VGSCGVHDGGLVAGASKQQHNATDSKQHTMSAKPRLRLYKPQLCQVAWRLLHFPFQISILPSFPFLPATTRNVHTNRNMNTPIQETHTTHQQIPVLHAPMQAQLGQQMHNPQTAPLVGSAAQQTFVHTVDIHIPDPLVPRDNETYHSLVRGPRRLSVGI